jgi:hypothetical protein
MKRNDFGDQTYWNRQPSRDRSKRYTRSLSPTKREPTATMSIPATAFSPRHTSSSYMTGLMGPGGNQPLPGINTAPYANPLPRAPSPTPSQSSSTRTVVSRSRFAYMQPKSKEEEDDAKDEKSFVKLMKSTMPKFSNEADWEMAIFELCLA